MKMTLKLSYPLVVGIGILCFQNRAVADLDLPRAEAELRNDPKGLIATESLKVLEAQQADVGNNSRLLAQLATQSSYPLVAVAAITRLRRTDLEQAYVLSLVRCWSATNIGSPLLIPYLEILTNGVRDEVFHGAFAVAGLLEPAKPENAVLTIRQIDRNQLIRWLFSDVRSKIPATIEALVVDRLLSEKQELETRQLDAIRVRLHDLVHFPGAPTAIYLLHSEQVHRNPAPLIKSVVEDASVDSTLKRMLFKKFVPELRRSLNVDQLSVPDKEKERYRKWLSTEAPK